MRPRWFAGGRCRRAQISPARPQTRADHSGCPAWSKRLAKSQRFERSLVARSYLLVSSIVLRP
jgi:hypothetical protein